jgi:hypothetical protein
VQAWPQPRGTRDHQQEIEAPWRSTDAPRVAEPVQTYAMAVGIPPDVVRRVLNQTPAQVWMYLPRCPHCKRWVSPKTGICRYARCPAGRNGAMVVPKTGWRWPPTHTSASHVQRALTKEARSERTPDSHAAWHSRSTLWAKRWANLSAPRSRYQGAGPILKALAATEAHVREGYQGGWLNPRSPSYDRHAASALGSAIDGTLAGRPDDELHALAAVHGEWGAAVSLTIEDKRRWLNPLTPADEKVRLVAKAQGGLGQAVSAGDASVAGQMAHVFQTALGSASVRPALLPRFEGHDPWREKLLSEFVRSNQRWLQTPRTQAELVHVTLCIRRLGGDLEPGEWARTVEAIRNSSAELGYSDLLKALDADPRRAAEMILENGWSPAEAKACLRARHV